jgi:hypothetical protein
MSDETKHCGGSGRPGYDPATGEIQDDPGLEDDPARAPLHHPAGDDVWAVLQVARMPNRGTGPFDPEHPFELSSVDDPMHDPFVGEHPELFGASAAEHHWRSMPEAAWGSARTRKGPRQP